MQIEHIKRSDDKSLFTIKVAGLNLWHDDYKTIMLWCEEQFGPQKFGITLVVWSYAIHTFYFENHNDATLFMLTWGNKDVCN